MLSIRRDVTIDRQSHYLPIEMNPNLTASLALPRFLLH
jgi:hypothetical protein